MKVTVVTPSFNQGKYIQETLLSVANQKYSNIEHVVIDGGSEDETVSILQKASSLASWVSEPDNGQAHAVNKGINATNGEIIGWLNSDDVYYENTISTVIEFFESYPETEVVYGMAEHINEDGIPFENYPTEAWNFDRLKERCFICQPALFFKRSIVKKNGLLNEKLNFCMDYEYWLRLGQSGVRFAYLEKKLAGSRLYSENKTLGSRIRVHHEINDMHKNLFESVPSRWIFNYAYVLTESKFDQAKTPIRFKIYLIIFSLSSLIHWNKKINSLEKTNLVALFKNIFKLKSKPKD